jgi:hypothetical protein
VFVKRIVVTIGFGVFVAACGGSSSSPTTPTPAVVVSTRVIGLIGNLTFGNVPVGQQLTSTLTITNSGNAALTVTGMTAPSGGAYTASTTTGTVTAGGSLPVTIFFKPTAAQTYSGTLTVNGDQTSGTNALAISGTGTNSTPTPAPPATISSTLTGTLTESGVGALSGALVDVTAGSDTGKSTTTDASGRFTLAGLSLGTLTVRGWKQGYDNNYQTLTLTTATATLNFTLSKSAVAPTPSPTPTPTPTPTPGGFRVGAICKDGTPSTATGSGACSSHGGVACWRYSDNTCRPT